MQGVRRDDAAAQFQRAQQRGQGGDLVALVVHFPLPQDQAVLRRPHIDQMQRAAAPGFAATQGLADKIFNLTDTVLTKDTGALDTEVSSITTLDQRLQDQITKIDEQVERFRQQLLEKFSALEQAIARVNNLLASIDADNQARYNS